jgi:hypothetical protein
MQAAQGTLRLWRDSKTEIEDRPPEQIKSGKPWSTSAQKCWYALSCHPRKSGVLCIKTHCTSSWHTVRERELSLVISIAVGGFCAVSKQLKFWSWLGWHSTDTSPCHITESVPAWTLRNGEPRMYRGNDSSWGSCNFLCNAHFVVIKYVK